MKSKSILVFSTQFMVTGGIESHLTEFCSYLSNEKIVIDLVIINSEMSCSQKEIFKNYCRKIYSANKNNAANKLFWLFRLASKLLFTKYNVLYTNGQGETVLWISRLCRYKKWVHHHHTSGDEVDQSTWGTNYKKTLIKADYIIACSNINAKSMYKSLNRQIDTIPCFSRQLKRLENISKDTSKVHLGYYGRLIKEKGIDTLCTLSNEPEFNNIQIHIWGLGENYPPSFFKQYKNINFHGSFESKEELIDVVSILDGFLLLSTHSEGLPVSLLEIMSIGMPWLATDKGGIPDLIIDKSITRVISSNSTYKEYKEQVLCLANDISKNNFSEKKAIETYNLKYASNIVTKKWLEIFEIN